MKVKIEDDDGTELARIEFVHLHTTEDGLYDEYSVRFAVERITAVGLHRRSINAFPRLKYNTLGLLKIALDSLTETELENEGGVSPSDMAGRQHRALPAFPEEGSSESGSDRSSFWR